jgi:hypothetical protein
MEVLEPDRLRLGGGGWSLPLPLSSLRLQECVQITLGDADTAAVARQTEPVMGEQSGIAPAIHQGR